MIYIFGIILVILLFVFDRYFIVRNMDFTRAQRVIIFGINGILGASLIFTIKRILEIDFSFEGVKLFITSVIVLIIIVGKILGIHRGFKSIFEI